MMPRRLTAAFAVAVVALCLCLPVVTARAQSKVFRIGAVSAGAPRSSPHWAAFAQRLGELGYVEGRNVSIEFRSAEGRPERFPELLSDLVRSGVDVLLPVGPEASLRAAQEATTTIPIVVVAIDYDPIARGYVGGLARPGGHTTGLFLRQPELTPKRLQLLQEIVPSVRRVVTFWDPFSADQLKEADAAARAAGLQLQAFEFRNPPYVFDGLMKPAPRPPVGALLGLASPMSSSRRRQ